MISTLQRAVEKSAELPPPFGQLLNLPNPRDFPGPLLSLINLLGEAGTPIRKGLTDLNKIIAIRVEYENNGENLLEAIITTRGYA